jgi:uncharacterized protein YpmS
MQPATLNQKRQILTTLAVLLIIVAIVAAVTVTNKKQTNMKNISSVTADATSQTTASSSSGANDPEAREYQSMFISGYKQQVVGKRISDISLSRVSGSSLTSQGFNSAIQKIESQAKA